MTGENGGVPEAVVTTALADGKTDDAVVTQTPEEKAAADALTPEQKAAADKEAADKKAADEKAKKPEKIVPETYADFKMPDGMEVDKEALEEFLPVAKDLKLSQEEAQKLVDTFAKQVQKKIAGNASQFKGMVEGWLTEARADADIGGANYDANLRLAKRGLAKFGSPKLSAVLNYTGVGNHVEFIRAWAKVGKEVSEDEIVPGGSGGSPQKTAASILYPNQ